MRLLRRTHTGEFTFTDNLHEIPPYAILSHTWGTPQDEVSYQDILDGTARAKEAYFKIRFIAEQAKKDDLEYFWVDTCCIDKRNDAELATAIRSMFQWYKNATVCYVYLSDVSSSKRVRDGEQAGDGAFRQSRWFKRGWTLQELIAPTRVQFYSRDQYIGTKIDLCHTIHDITGIEADVLQGHPLEAHSFRARLRWAEGRDTTVPEDAAYALMGLCGVTMTPHYGEGKEEARKRLERKILKRHGENALDQATILVPNNSRVSGGKTDVLERRRTQMEMLSFDNIDSRKTTIKRALRKTCRWVLKHDAFTAWQKVTSAAKHHGFLWIKGKPGAGKSVLIKFIESHIDDNREQRDVCISFYFNARGERLERSLVGMYRSLLMQLLLAVPSLQVVLDDARTVTGDSDATVQELQKLFLKASLMLKERRLFCFVDALDECHEHDVQQMVNHFQEVGEETFDANIPIHVCFASRHYPTLDIPTGLQLVLEKTDEHADDLSEYVKSQSFQVGMSGNPQRIPPSVREVILTKANGVFLWVVLVVEILKKEYQNGRIHAVHERLSQIPKNLSDLFKDILQRDRDNIEEFLLCLKWILHAKRPLALREFYFAMMSGIEGQNLEWNPEILDDFMHGFLLSSSKGLAELTKGKTPRVQFIHESVRDFLIVEEGFRYIEEATCISTGRNHEILKQCCLRGMQNDAGVCKREMGMLEMGQDPGSSSWKPSQSKVVRANTTERFPFLEYATSFVLYHADHASLDVPQGEFLVQFDLNDWLEKANFLQKHDVNLYRKPLDLVYVCAQRDHAGLIRVLASKGYNLEQSSEQRYGTPLFAAFANKNENAARVLLEQGGSTNQDRIVWEVIVNDHKGLRAYERSKVKLPFSLWALREGYKNLAIYFLRTMDKSLPEYGAVAESVMDAAAGQGSTSVIESLLDSGISMTGDTLWEAIRFNHEQTVDMILGRSAEVENLEKLLGSVLIKTSRLGNVKMAQVLLSYGADVNAQSTGLDNALHAAAGQGHEEIVAMLLAHGADVNAQSTGLNNALHAAAGQGHEEIVAMLLAHGADVNARGGRYGTALQAASAAPHEGIVEILLAHGADINAYGGEYGTALHAALMTRNETITDSLLAKGASIDYAPTMSKSALETAAEWGNERILTMILVRETDVNFQKTELDNALLTASVNHDDKAVELLLSHGADANAQGGVHGNALQAASERGKKRLAKLLLSHGADVNAQGVFWGNALQSASVYGDQVLVELLLAHGADVNAQGGSYGNALQAAAANGAVGVASMLLDHGADINAKGGPDGCALVAARLRGYSEVVQLLLDRGAVEVPRDPAWEDCQMQLMLLEQQNKKHRKMARQEHDDHGRQT